MRGRYLIFLLFSLLLTGCLGAAITGAGLAYDHNNVSRKVSDFYLKTQIENKLSTTEFKGNRIAVTVFNQIVLLTGQVANQQLQQRATQIVKLMPDVKRVYNGLTLGPPISFGEQTKDAWITTQVKTKIVAAKGTDPTKIKVVTEDGIVYLIGFVTKEQADIAIHAAQYTSGVKKVVLIL